MDANDDNFCNDDNADAHISGLCTVRARSNPDLDLDDLQQLTTHQETIVQDDCISCRKYNKISEFGVRPPELKFVFETPVDYFRMCYIDNEFFNSEESMKLGLDQNLECCRWFDGFGRNIYIRENAMDEILELVNKNLDDQAYLESVGSSHQEFVRRSNTAVKQKIL